jgi:hypothetical protein
MKNMIHEMKNIVRQNGNQMMTLKIQWEPGCRDAHLSLATEIERIMIPGQP